MSSKRERPPINHCFPCNRRIEVGEAVAFIAWESSDNPSPHLDLTPVHLHCADRRLAAGQRPPNNAGEGHPL